MSTKHGPATQQSQKQQDNFEIQATMVDPVFSRTAFAENPALTLPSPYFNESHHRLRKAVRAWVEEHLTDNVAEWDAAGHAPPEVYKQAAKDGLLVPLGCGARIDPWVVDEKDNRSIIAGIKPEEWDGFHDLVMHDEIYRCGSTGPGSGLFSGLVIGFPMLNDYGSDELKKRVIPSILRGDKRICLAITEPEAGSENKNISTMAVKSECGKYYIVNGGKKWITNGVNSDYFATAVRTAGKPGDRHGISCLLIPRTEGVKTDRLFVGGMKSAGTSIVAFNDVKVPVENLLGKENEGLKIVFSNFNHERVYTAMGSSSLCRQLLEEAVSHAQKRLVDGEPLIEKAVVRHRIAKMAVLTETQDAWLHQVIYELKHLSKEEGNRLLGGVSALLKANCSLVLEPVASSAVQILGGIGYTQGGKGDRVERMYREIKGYAIPAGSEDVMLDQIGRAHV